MKKKNNITTILIILGIVAVAAFGAHQCGFLQGGEAQETEWRGGELPTVFGSASDRTQGLYEVSYWLVQKGPVFAPALLPQTAQFYWKGTPDMATTKSVVRIPQFMRNSKYDFCDACPYSVKVLRKPVPPKVPEEPTEELPEKGERL